MSLEEKVGQMFLAHWPGGDAAKTASECHLGGYLFFGSYFEPRNMESAAAGIEEIQNQQNIPMFMAVDEEGGYVNRVSYYPQYRDSIFASGRKLFNLGGIELIAAEAKERAALLSKLGLNMNMAPVCDLSGDPGDFIYYRSYGDDPQHVSDCVTAVVEASVSGSVAPVLKHFPGYGPNGDTHTDVVTDERDFETFVNADFLPFLAGIDAGAKCVMVCHNVVSCMDETLPASLSPEVHRVLRENLGFTGVIITDDVSMSAITKFTDGAEAAVLAVEAGNDLICCSDFKTQISAVINAVNEGRISEERINESVLRILELKLDLGIITWGED
ncbi:MAG: beta-hexosaminidase [Oscillospiraceae bacterium]|nr:beta-hexosaminidase [Oscillospiraceae bacterium]